MYDKKTHSFHALNIQTINVMTVLCKTLLGNSVHSVAVNTKAAFICTTEGKPVIIYCTVPVLKELRKASFINMLFALKEDVVLIPFHCHFCHVCLYYLVISKE